MSRSTTARSTTFAISSSSSIAGKIAEHSGVNQLTNKGPAVEGGFRTAAEGEEGARNKAQFDANPISWEKKMENFPKYVRRQNLTRFLVLYEIFKQIVEVKGSIV